MVLQQLYTPAIVLGAGTTVLSLIPLATAFCQTSSISLSTLATLTTLAFALNCASVSVPGRIDDPDAIKSNNDDNNNKKDDISTTGTTSNSNNRDMKIYQTVYSPKKGRSLIAPAGWAFAIWGPIYIGETLFCGSILWSTLTGAATTTATSASAILTALPDITAPFVAANIMQSLWCAAFRPSYMSGSWEKYISVAMLGGTAYCLSLLHTNTTISSVDGGWYYFVPLTLHFGWTTAATLVNFNGSLAMSNASDRMVIACGHASTVVATLLGVGIAWTYQLPLYGWTVAWALAACGNGMQQRQKQQQMDSTLSTQITRGMKVQKWLCYVGAFLCAAGAASVSFVG